MNTTDFALCAFYYLSVQLIPSSVQNNILVILIQSWCNLFSQVVKKESKEGRKEKNEKAQGLERLSRWKLVNGF